MNKDIEKAINDLPDGRNYTPEQVFSFLRSVIRCGKELSEADNLTVAKAMTDVGETRMENERLVRKLAAAREALEVYGNEEHWQDIFDDGKWEFKPNGAEEGGYELALSALTALDEME